MSEIYPVIVGILGILAISGLFVGVTNDAVNFLNSAIGSKAASMKVILTVVGRMPSARNSRKPYGSRKSHGNSWSRRPYSGVLLRPPLHL